MFKLKITDSNTTIHNKSVVYFGKTFTVPKWAKYLATDEDGRIFCYSEKPVRKCDVYINAFNPNVWLRNNKAGIVDAIDLIDYEGDWKESLQEV